ncbi:dTDP-4-dehydrorhamnose reductase [Prosthecochloris aestuarii DSM 271]|uniref:dTDP-4-dehydrorhamnose reductase n=1 Tax=Prosthecochloris aestuarii (strain DSM 271 / SK 413) TaxID=290512 RepID=B4S3K3_PROA2|nr:dTDP-4-dehydrorhamnose reductase [Prosthecochloris aestuarii]ACF46742.1 dTDP-4-dehydrorhamnose reductase [Prosthecochloris aestuarii DSM 271]
MNILVTGSKGQLGSEIRDAAMLDGGLRFFFCDLAELDITDRDAVVRMCERDGIDVIINCAAYTAVDRAEDDADTAMRVNRDGPGVLAECARERGALLLQVSTDYVFNGESSVPYRECDEVSPLGVYGQSKWEGEELVRRSGASYMIFRTSWLYSAHGNNFVKTMLRLGAERDELRVVFDQVGTPCYAADLARALMHVLERVEPGVNYAATYHFSNEGVCSWYDFAVMIMRLGGLGCRVVPIESSEFPAKVTRPHFSVLNKGKIKADWGVDVPHWMDGLERMMRAPLARGGASRGDA